MKIKVLRKWGRLNRGLVCQVPSHTGNIMINRGFAEEVKKTPDEAKAVKPQLRRRRRKKDPAPAEAAEG